MSFSLGCRLMWGGLIPDGVFYFVYPTSLFPPLERRSSFLLLFCFHRYKEAHCIVDRCSIMVV